MNPLPTVGLKTLIIFGLSFAKQLAHGLVKRFAGYVTLLNAFVLITPNFSGGEYVSENSSAHCKARTGWP